MSDVYEKFQERLDMFPQGFPKTKSGVELEILKHLFTPEEVEIALTMKPYPEPVSAIAEKTGRDEKALAEILYGMSKRGLILRFRASEEICFYFLAPWMIGIWEFQLNNLTEKNIGLYEKYFAERMTSSKTDEGNIGFRVIPVEEEIRDVTEIQPFEKVSEIINAHDTFAVSPCICRKEAEIKGTGCSKLMESCLSFGAAATYYVENEMGREITKEEALGVLKKAEEDGLIHFSSNHSDNKVFICNCCGCCCKALAPLVKHDKPAVIAKSNYYAVHDDESCTNCEDCLDRCQVEAIRSENDLTLIDEEKCIGCGLCVSVCPTESLSMVVKSSEKTSPAFANEMEMLQALGKQENKSYPFE
ncbi:MAG: 4Fe-4S dicluster domain-containing protein [Proteobacteria bacterium]|nr:4Fe-4S dicluster domain-containing protein [Pseudomonadota bacterium]